MDLDFQAVEGPRRLAKCSRKLRPNASCLGSFALFFIKFHGFNYWSNWWFTLPETKNGGPQNDGPWKAGTLPETNSSPLKIGHPKRKRVFQPSIFRCELLVSGRVTPFKHGNFWYQFVRFQGGYPIWKFKSSPLKICQNAPKGSRRKSSNPFIFEGRTAVKLWGCRLVVWICGIPSWKGPWRSLEVIT